MVEIATITHNSILYISRNDNGIYKFNGFDPNHRSISPELCNLARSLTAVSKNIEMWTSRDRHHASVCVGLTWLFAHNVMFNDLQPIITEKIDCKHTLYTRCQTHMPNFQEGKYSSIGYRKKTDGTIIGLIYNS